MSLRQVFSLVLLAATLGVLGTSTSARAQLFSRGDLFGPGALPPMLSIEAGFGQHLQAGTYDCECGARFEGQKGNGFLANLMYELPLDYSWVLGLKGGVDFKKINGSEMKVEQGVYRFAYRDDSLSLENPSFDRTAEVNLTYLGVAPFVKYQFSRVGAFIQMAPHIQFLVSSHLLHRRELLTTRFKDEQGIEHPIVFNNGEQFEVLEDYEVPNVKGMRLSLQLTAGYDLELSDHSLIAPMITYELPFTTVRDELANDWKINSLFGSVAIKFRMD